MLVLASTSPRRRQLLALTGWRFQVTPADVDEGYLPGEPPCDYVRRLARAKASAVVPGAPVGSIILAADTAVVQSDEVLGKPGSPSEAVGMLQRLRDDVHQVYTGLAVVRVDDGKLLTDWCVTNVRMRAYGDALIWDYVASGDPFDKAGGYAIQHAGFDPVESLEGCYANVVGLPVCHLTHLLRRFGLLPPADAPAACQDISHSDCSIYKSYRQYLL